MRLIKYLSTIKGPNKKEKKNGKNVENATKDILSYLIFFSVQKDEYFNYHRNRAQKTKIIIAYR